MPTIPPLVAAPLPGAQVVHTVSVPNQPQLLGCVVFAQAFQLEGACRRWSAASFTENRGGIDQATVSAPSPDSAIGSAASSALVGSPALVPGEPRLP